MSWLYFTSSYFSKHKNLQLSLFLTREQLILSPLDPQTGTHYNYLESRWFPGRRETWNNPKQQEGLASSKPGQWEPVQVAWKTPPVLLGCYPRVTSAPYGHRKEHRGQSTKGILVGHLHRAGLYQVLRERTRPETCELKRESSQYSRSICWVRSKKAMPITTCISTLSQPVFSIPCNPFLSYNVLPEWKSHVPQEIIAHSWKESCHVLLQPLQPLSKLGP